MHQTMERDGAAVIVRRGSREERHEFATEREAAQRMAFVTECLTWIGTPFRDCAAVKGRNGGVDCAMMLRAAAIDAGLIEPFDPPRYSPTHMLAHSDEVFLSWLTEKIGMCEVPTPSLGDVVMWQFGKCFSHGAVLINDQEVVHAYKLADVCMVSKIDEPLLQHLAIHVANVRRPVKYLTLWGTS